MSNFLYHRVPEDMVGDVLYPLNQLKTIYPELYDKKAGKYKGREKVMELRIPVLDCLWNDVLHFTAVPPNDIQRALLDSGSKVDYKWKSFKIDPHLLDPNNTIIYLNKIRVPLGAIIPEEEFVPFDPDNLSEYSTVPDLTREYFKKIFSEGGVPLTYGKIAHILYKGSLDISNVEVV
jgi:hypothetical protein